MNKTPASGSTAVESPSREPTTPITIAVSLPARIHRDQDGVIWADVPALPGCVAGGAELDEVLSNLREAAEGWLLAKNDLETKGWPKG
ncbi:MAG: type II toxin-antitoxin system HicB family antitoxin [Isosphaeraceae bacterium]